MFQLNFQRFLQNFCKCNGVRYNSGEGKGMELLMDYRFIGNLTYLKRLRKELKQLKLKSSSRPVACGIPQGSCLGPLLFMLYVNDFKTCLKFSKANLYGDGTEVSLSSNETGDVMQNFQAELESISE